MKTVFIEPLDVLTLRGNKLFGDPGSYGESLVPPWPSVAAGAIRSMMLARDGDPAAFAKGDWTHPALGSPREPGLFTVTAFHLARKRTTTPIDTLIRSHPDFHLARKRDDDVEPLFAIPADLLIEEAADGARVIRSMRPTVPAGGLASSNPLTSLPVLPQDKRTKPLAGLWLTVAGWRAYLDGKPIAADHLVAREELWRYDPRVGVGLSPATRHVEEGKLFTASTVAFKSGMGFLACVANVDLNDGELLRFGGDGHGARMSVVNTEWPQPDFDAIARARRARFVLTTPGVFERGWLPTGISHSNGTCRFDLHGVRARLVCAALPRAETVSGFDLANWRPKPALRAAPGGSVYWLDEIDAMPEALRKLAGIGLWPAELHNDARRAEGFNRMTLAAY